MNTYSRIKQLIFYFFIILIFLLPFHAFIVTFLKSGLNLSFPHSSILIHIWKELLLLLIGLMVMLGLIFKQLKLSKWKYLDIFILLYFLFGICITVFLHKNFVQFLYGFKYDYIFLIAYVLSRFFNFSDIQKKILKNTLILSASMTVLFGLIWYFYLPRDFLKIFGYSTNVGDWQFQNTLPIYHVMDRFSDAVRLTSTFSGPNHFGAYLLLIIPLVFTTLIKFIKNKVFAWKTFVFICFLIFSVLALFLTYSRSAWIGFFIQICFFILIVLKPYRKIFKFVIFTFISCFVFSIAFVSFNFQSISNYILKCSMTTELSQEKNNNFIKCSSTRGHFDRSLDGLIRSSKEPLGHGLGTPKKEITRILLFEMGYGGLFLFLSIIISAIWFLWKRSYFIAIEKEEFWLFLSLVGLSTMAMFLHAWEDPATAIIFWSWLGMVVSKD